MVCTAGNLVRTGSLETDDRERHATDSRNIQPRQQLDDGFRQNIADSWPMSIDDTAARKDWGWRPQFNLKSMTEDMIKKLTKKLTLVN